MNGISFIFILLFLEARASFLDDFHGAISNINSGFGKLIGDVVTDVRDTIYCTVSAVEQVMVQNGLLDKHTLYNQKCKGLEKPTEQTLNFRDGSHSRTISKIRKHSVIHHKHSRRISHESSHSVENVNKTIIDVLGNQTDLKNVTDTFADETNRLAEIRKVLQQESENISKKLNNELNQLHLNKKSPVESVWEEIKFLNDLRQNSQNNTEVNEIRRIFDKVTHEMDLKINNQQVLTTHELEELKKELYKISSNNVKLNATTENQNVLSREPITLDDVALKKYNQVEDPKPKASGNTNTQKQDKSLFSLGLESLASFFNSMSASSDDLNSAKQIITDNQHAEKLLNHFFKGQQFDFGKR